MALVNSLPSGCRPSGLSHALGRAVPAPRRQTLNKHLSLTSDKHLLIDDALSGTYNTMSTQWLKPATTATKQIQRSEHKRKRQPFNLKALPYKLKANPPFAQIDYSLELCLPRSTHAIQLRKHRLIDAPTFVTGYAVYPTNA